MLSDKKPEKKEEKEPVPVMPTRAKTPKLLRAALEMKEKTGLRGAMAKMKDKKNNRSCVSLQVQAAINDLYLHSFFISSHTANRFLLQPFVPNLEGT